MSQRTLFIIAAMVDTILLIAFLWMLSTATNPAVTDQQSDTNEASAEIDLPLPTETAMPTEALGGIPGITLAPIPTESPTLTPIPSPTRILPEEPTKSPYIFQTPVFIPPNMRERPTLTPTRTRTR